MGDDVFRPGEQADLSSRPLPPAFRKAIARPAPDRWRHRRFDPFASAIEDDQRHVLARCDAGDVPLFVRAGRRSNHRSLFAGASRDTRPRVGLFRRCCKPAANSRGDRGAVRCSWRCVRRTDCRCPGTSMAIGVALAGAQGSGQEIRPISHALGSFQNAGAGFFGDALRDRSASQHAANGADGGVGLTGNIDKSRWQSIPLDNHCSRRRRQRKLPLIRWRNATTKLGRSKTFLLLFFATRRTDEANNAMRIIAQSRLRLVSPNGAAYEFIIERRTHFRKG